MTEKVLVLGAGFAGLNCALSLDRNDFDVKLVDRTSKHVFRPGLIELIRGRFDPDNLTVDLSDFLSDTSIDFEQAEVEDVSPDMKTVETRSGSLDYDYLVVALGSERKGPEFSLQYADDFYSLESAEKAVEKIDEGEKVAVIGSGYTGVEVASELKEEGKEVQIIDSSTRPMPSAPEEASHSVLDYFNRNEIKFMGGKKVEIVTNYGLELEDGSEVKADQVVWCGGLEPSGNRSNLLESDEEGIEVNKGLSASGYEDVFVAGDSASTEFLKTAQNAEKQGLHVARNISSRDTLLKDFDTGVSPLVVSLGKTGMLIWNDRVFESRFFRYLKDMIMRFYFLNLRRRKLSSGFLGSVKSSFSVLNIMGK